MYRKGPLSRPRRVASACALLAAIATLGAGPRARAADDWDAVPSNGSGTADATAADGQAAAPAHHRHSAGNAAPADAAPPAAGEMVACGEPAVAPAPRVAAIVAQIDQAWGANVQVYQSVVPMGPHARPGGCVFYNGPELVQLIGGRLDVRDNQVVVPLLYAIFAHEVGHEYHGDFDPSRAGVSNQTKELEADRFAGYTMQKLGVPATGLAPYWSMTGDEFGRGASHGTSTQRVDAFKEGWHLAQWNRDETSQPVAAAGAESVAPDDADDAAP